MTPTEVRDEQAMIAMTMTSNMRRRRGWSQLSPEQQKLAEKFLPMARKMAKPMKEQWRNEHTAFESAVCMALVEAAYSFKPDRNVRFSTFARFRIQGALRSVQQELMSNRYPRPMTNLRTITFVPGAEERDSLMLTSRENGVGRDFEDTEEVRHWLKKLPRKHAETCMELYINFRTQQQTADALKLSKSRVCSLHAEALELLRESAEIQAAALEIGLDVRRN